MVRIKDLAKKSRREGAPISTTTLNVPTVVGMLRGFRGSRKSTPQPALASHSSAGVGPTLQTVYAPGPATSSTSSQESSTASTSSTSTTSNNPMDLLAQAPAAKAEPVASVTATENSMDALEQKSLPTAMSSVNPFAGKSAAELQSAFINSAIKNDFASVKFLLKYHSEKLGDVVINSIQVLIDNDQADMLKLLMPLLKEQQINSFDQDLPALIHKRKLDVLKVLLENNVPMQSLMTIASYEILNKLKADPNAVEMVDVLLTASISRHPAITFRVSRVLMDMQMPEANFSDALDRLLVDAVSFEPFKDPQITPQGQTFSATSLENRNSNPLTRDPMQANQLRPNLLLQDLMMFILQNPAASEKTALFPPMLLSLYTGQPLVNPVMTENGITEEAGRQKDAYKDVTMRDCCDYYRKLGIFAAKPAAPQQPEAVSATTSNTL